MEHIKYLIGFLLWACTIDVYSQEPISIKIIENQLLIDFELLDRFETLSAAPYDSPFRISYDNPRYLGFKKIDIKPVFPNGDTTIVVRSKKNYKIESHYSENNPVGIWRVYDEEGNLKNRIFFNCKVLQEIEFFDSIGNLLCSIQYPEDSERRIEKWFYNGKSIKTILKNCDGTTSVYLYNQEGTVCWLFVYNDKKLIEGISYDENSLIKYSLNPR